MLLRISICLFVIIAILILCDGKKKKSCKQYSTSEVDVEFEKISKKNSEDFETVERKTKKKKTKSQRKSQFKQKMKKLNKKNAQNPSFCEGPNKFTAMEDDEFASSYLGLTVTIDDVVQMVNHSTPTRRRRRGLLPTYVDHSDSTGPVENQLQCGSCWTFSASHSLAGTLTLLKNFSVMSYSKQQLVDCVKINAYGCGGGGVFAAFEYLKKNHLKTESEYPYVAQSGQCQAGSTGNNILIKGYGYLYEQNVDLIKERLVIQPMAVAMHVSEQFQAYSSGVYEDNDGECIDKDSKNPKPINHDMTVVGYGYDSVLERNYWKIKNSWGTDWGEDGFVRVKMGTNECNVELLLRYPIPSDTATEADTTDTVDEDICVNVAKDCAYYDSIPCKDNTYVGNKKKTKHGWPCSDNEFCRNSDHDSAPWCVYEYYYRRKLRSDWDFCFCPCQGQC